MEYDPALVMSGYPTYRALEWVDPALRIRWVVPRATDSEEINANLSNDPRRREALRLAADTRRVTVTRPVDLPNGGRGVLVCVPVRTDEKLIGYLVGVFSYKDL